jgi:hypothetical protein
MTTDSDAYVVGDDAGSHSPHSAAPHSGERWPETVKARPRAGAREYAPSTAQSQPDSAVDAGGHADARDDSGSDVLSNLRDVLLDTFTPPDVVAHDMPALARVWSYARRGEWTGEDGLPRTFGVVYAAVVSVPVTWLAYQVAWLVERPARLSAAVLLYWLAAQFMPLPMPLN